MNRQNGYTHFGIAWRHSGDTGWSLVKDPPYGWTADPFLVEYRGQVFLFAEIFLYKSERNGKIGYCVFDGTSFGEWTITMDRHWHLSYPNVFVKNDRLYMCPETWQLGEVVIYELERFPDKWKKKQSLISDVTYCDSTFFEYDGETYMFTYRRASDEYNEAGLIYRYDDKHGLCDEQVFSESPENCRCGGNVLNEDGKRIRIAQNGIPYYGKELIFYEIDSVYPKYREHELYRLGKNEIVLNDFDKQNGFHTYNRLNDLEVIDFRYQSYDESDISAEAEAMSHTHKVFLNKYGA